MLVLLLFWVFASGHHSVELKFLCVQSLGTFFNLELDALAFLERFVAIHFDGRKMHKDILVSIIGCDELIKFLVRSRDIPVLDLNYPRTEEEGEEFVAAIHAFLAELGESRCQKYASPSCHVARNTAGSRRR